MTSSRKRVIETPLRYIDLYSPEYPENIELYPVKEYLESYFPTVRVAVKPPILKRIKEKDLERTAEAIVQCRVKDPIKEEQSFEPMFAETEFEKRAATGKARLGGVVYDGRKFEELLVSILSKEFPLERAGLLFTQRLLTTFSRDDLRHHLRTVVCGFPCLISIPGVVEAPAKPREFYLLRQQLEARGAGELELEQLKSSFSARYVDHDDPRLGEVLKGLALQAIVFHLTLKPFCDKAKCRLFNAHWQEDLISSQIANKSLCREHRALLEGLRENPAITW